MKNNFKINLARKLCKVPERARPGHTTQAVYPFAVSTWPVTAFLVSRRFLGFTRVVITNSPLGLLPS